MSGTFGELTASLTTSTVLPKGASTPVTLDLVSALALDAAPQTALVTEEQDRQAADAANQAATAIVATKTITRVSPRIRAPGSADDTSRGYSAANGASAPMLIADRWSQGGRVWTCQQAVAGKGVWAPDYAALGYPGSALATSPLLFAGGTLRMVPGYTGAAINVVNPVSGANKDIGLLADDSLDELALWSFRGSAGYLEVATIYDQSGAGNHINQPTAANRYVIVSGMRVGRAVALINDSETVGTTVTRFMLIPSSLTVAANGPVSGALVVTNRNYNNFSPYMTLIGSNGQTYGVGLDQSVGLGNGASGAVIENGGMPPLNGFVAGFASAPTSGGTSSLFINGRYAVAGNGGGASYAGGFLGVTAAGQNIEGAHEVAGIMIYGGMLAAPTDTAVLTAGLEQHFGLVPQLRDNLILDGDSITYGYGTSYNQDYPHLMMPMLTHDFQINNTGVVGAKTGDRLAGLPGILKYLNDANGQNVFVEWSGTNDILSSVPLATMQSNLEQIIAAAKAAGCKTVAVTTLPNIGFAGNQTMTAQWQAWNAWLLAGSSGADVVADVASDPTMGNPANAVAGTLYLEGEHPTTLGHSYTAPIIAQAINGLAP